MGHGVQGGDLKEEEEVQVLRPPNTGGREILPVLRQEAEMRLRKIMVWALNHEGKERDTRVQVIEDEPIILPHLENLLPILLI